MQGLKGTARSEGTTERVAVADGLLELAEYDQQRQGTRRRHDTQRNARHARHRAGRFQRGMRTPATLLDGRHAVPGDRDAPIGGLKADDAVPSERPVVDGHSGAADQHHPALRAEEPLPTRLEIYDATTLTGTRQERQQDQGLSRESTHVSTSALGGATNLRLFGASTIRQMT
jgi:hypothetical protein